MIRVNLLPGGKKRRSSRGFSFKMPSFGGGGGGGALGQLSDRWILAGVLIPLICFGVAAWLYVSVTSEEEEVGVALEEAVQDSVRFADIIERTNLLQARSDSIAEKVAIIQEIDEGRYVWPHVLDEVARALPDYTWLGGILQVSPGSEPEMQLSGQTGNNLALAALEQLEASPFLRDVELIVSEQNLDQTTGQTVYGFQLDVAYSQPPLDMLETVPLFDNAPVPAEVGADGAVPVDSLVGGDGAQDAPGPDTTAPEPDTTSGSAADSA